MAAQTSTSISYCALVQGAGRESQATMNLDTSSDWADRKIRDWLLALLRFAITRDEKDAAGVLTLAEELDMIGGSSLPSAPTFFRRTTDEVSNAIRCADAPTSAAVLRRHTERIEKPRLKRAFAAA